jgi:uncharacterized protein (TIGR00369 family)
MPPEPEDWAQLEEKARSTFWGTLGCEVEYVEEEKATVRLVCTERHMNTGGIVHGGVLASLLDNTMGLALMNTYPGELIITAQLNIHYLAPSTGGKLRCEASTVHRTRRTATMEGRIYGPDGELLAWAGGAFRAVSAPV